MSADAPPVTDAPPSASSSFTYAEVAQINDKKKMYTVIHDKVYNMTQFADEHPGGEEVLLDVAGLDSTEAFEDVGHSDEAREILKDLLVGELKRLPTDPKPKVAPPPTAPADGAVQAKREATSYGFYIYALLVLLGAVWYFYVQGDKQTVGETPAPAPDA